MSKQQIINSLDNIRTTNIPFKFSSHFRYRRKRVSGASLGNVLDDMLTNFDTIRTHYISGQKLIKGQLANYILTKNLELGITIMNKSYTQNLHNFRKLDLGTITTLEKQFRVLITPIE